MMKAAVRETHKGESVMQKKEHKLQYPVAWTRSTNGTRWDGWQNCAKMCSVQTD
jgi:hypothetical protein